MLENQYESTFTETGYELPPKPQETLGTETNPALAFLSLAIVATGVAGIIKKSLFEEKWPQE